MNVVSKGCQGILNPINGNFGGKLTECVCVCVCVFFARTPFLASKVHASQRQGFVAVPVGNNWPKEKVKRKYLL